MAGEPTEDTGRPWFAIALAVLVLLLGAAGIPAGPVAYKVGYGIGVVVVAAVVYLWGS